MKKLILLLFCSLQANDLTILPSEHKIPLLKHHIDQLITQDKYKALATIFSQLDEEDVPEVLEYLIFSNPALFNNSFDYLEKFLQQRYKATQKNQVFREALDYLKKNRGKLEEGLRQNILKHSRFALTRINFTNSQAIQGLINQIQHGLIDINYRVNDLTLLMYAIDSDQVELVRELLKHPDLEINAVDETLQTALHKACNKDFNDKTHQILILLNKRKDLKKGLKDIANFTSGDYAHRRAYSSDSLKLCQ